MTKNQAAGVFTVKHNTGGFKGTKGAMPRPKMPKLALCFAYAVHYSLAVAN